MKKLYRKPALVKGDVLSKVTAIGGPSIPLMCS
jgi:hypothetical protein